MYVSPHRVWFSVRPFGLKTGMHFAHFGQESGLVFEGSTGLYERLNLGKKNIRIRSGFEEFCLHSNLIITYFLPKGHI